MEQNCVLLDTSFFIRLLNEEDPLHDLVNVMLEIGRKLSRNTILWFTNTIN